MGSNSPSKSADRNTTLAEVALIVVVFFLCAGGYPPSVNEAHYLTKAKHYWNPNWCRGDLFLESANTHLVFYWTVGWLTRFLSLPAAAWIGRLLMWTALACGWQRLSRRFTPLPLMSVLSAAIFVGLQSRLHMAGEWVVGGVEAKGFAYALVFFGLAAIADGNWRRAWLWLGAASAFHVLVGGWSTIAAGVVWATSRTARQTAPLRPMLPFLAGGFALALFGLVPVLASNYGIAPDVVREANVIYVFDRLPHHLVALTFDPWFVRRHAATFLAFYFLSVWQKEPTVGTLRRFVFAAALIAATGVVIEVATQSSQTIGASLLRFYWYRLSDAAVPLGVTLSVSVWLAWLEARRPRDFPMALGLALLLVGIGLGQDVLRRRTDPRPTADAQTLPTWEDDPASMRQSISDWRAVCQWIEKHTEPGDLILTPREQQTFKWYAQRPEFVCWKDVPQDAATLVEWRTRIDHCNALRLTNPKLGNFSQRAFQQLVNDYPIRYVVVDRFRDTFRPTSRRVYPSNDGEFSYNATYEVYPAR